MAVTREELLTYLSKKTRADLGKIDDDTELFSSGLIDSFVMVDLMMWLEKKIKARVSPDDIESFDTISQILAYAAKNAR